MTRLEKPEEVFRDYLSRLEKLEKALLDIKEGRTNREGLIEALKEVLTNIEPIRKCYPFNELKSFLGCIEGRLDLVASDARIWLLPETVEEFFPSILIDRKH